MSLVRKEASWKETELLRDVSPLWADSPPSIKSPAPGVSGRADQPCPEALSLEPERATGGPGRLPVTWSGLGEPVPCNHRPYFQNTRTPSRRHAVPVKHLHVKINTPSPALTCREHTAR